MRKRLLRSTPSLPGADWLPVEELASVEITSEDPAAPIEAALRGDAPGWRAAEPGRQTIRLVFDDPQMVRHIRLVVVEAELERTQEIALRWSARDDRSFHEVVRQQFTFSPTGATREVEDYHVNLDGVSVLVLEVVPNISGGPARATVAELRLG
jgi:hypothetical protein